MTGEEQEKFFREARAAAQLKHPNIVSVHEVGRDSDSLYIVSDYVRGATLGDWLTGQQLTNREAAELCAIIADALHHAHEQGIVHRDLKPANIMMDGDNQPHLMDFGLARREVGEVTVTVDGQILGTPAYMSPEQAQGEAHTADRRSDVYSLGVILFQLLTGELPFRGNARMLIKQVIDDEPPSPRKLNGNVSKDLETITLKCLEKNPAKRYQSTKEFSQECRRYLSGEPINARPIGRIARAWRWARRRPTAAALLAMLIIGASVLAVGFVRERELRREIVTQKNEAVARKAEAESERASAEAVVNFLIDDVLAKAAPEEVRDKAVRDILVKTLIEPAAATVGQRFKDKPLVEAAVQNTLGQTLAALGRSDLAMPHAKRALILRRTILGDDDPGTIVSLSNYAMSLELFDNNNEAETLFKKALEQRRKILGDNHPDTITSLSQYAHVLESMGRAKEAEPLHKKVLEQNRKLLGEDHPVTIKSLSEYAHGLELLSRPNEAVPLHEKALKLNRRLLGEDHPKTIKSLFDYARALDRTGRTEDAEPFYKEALQMRRKVLGNDHPDTIRLGDYYARLLVKLGRAQEAVQELRQSLEQHHKLFGEHDLGTCRIMSDLAIIYLNAGQIEEANEIYPQLIEGNSFSTALRIAVELGSGAEIDQLMQAAVMHEGEKTPSSIDTLVLGELRLVARNLDSSEAAIRTAINTGGNSLYCDKSLGWCLLAQGEANKSRDAFLRVVKDIRRADGTYDFEKAAADQWTAAYFLDLITEKQYVQHFADHHTLACFPWFYVAQRREIEGSANAAIEAYQHCVDHDKGDNRLTLRALADWRLRKLKEPPKAVEK